jgi:hypothetical protein
MKYKGKLYGKVGKHYFPLEATSHDVDMRMELLRESRDLLVLCTLIDKSGQCKDMVEKIDKIIKQEK